MSGQTSCCMVSCLMGVSPGCSLCSTPVAMLGDIMSLQNLPSGNWRVGNWTWPSRNSECSHSKCWTLPVRHVSVYQRVDLHCPIVFQGFSLVSHCFPMVFPWFFQHSTLGMISYLRDDHHPCHTTACAIRKKQTWSWEILKLLRWEHHLNTNPKCHPWCCYMYQHLP